MTRLLSYLCFFLCLYILSTSVVAQDNHVYLFSLERTGKGEFHLHSPKYLSSFNSGGYTNQPSFTHRGDVLLSVRGKNDVQNDIYQLNLSNRKYKRLTRTAAFEYSPVIHPDEEHLSVIRKSDGKELDQQVCNIHLKTGQMECVTTDIHDVGYFTWLGMDALGLFRIEEAGSRLSYYDVKENKSRRITTSIGRTLASDKSGGLIYVHKFTNEYWYIKRYDPKTSEIKIIVQTPAQSEDFVLAADGTFFMGKDQVLYTFLPDNQKEWTKVGDLSVYGIKYISRLAISPDMKKLVVVSSNTKS